MSIVYNVLLAKEIYAHKCIVSARNATMAAMLDGRFAESNAVNVATVNIILTLSFFLTAVFCYC